MRSTPRDPFRSAVILSFILPAARSLSKTPTERDWYQQRSSSLPTFRKIYQACDNIKVTGYQPLSPADVPMHTRGLHCLYETMLYTDKPWLAPMDYSSGDDKLRELNMYDIVFGSDFARNHYLTWSIVTPESPLIYSDFSCESTR